MLVSEQRIIDLLSGDYEGSDRDQLAIKLNSIVRQARANGLSDDRIESLLDSWLQQYPMRQQNWISAYAGMADVGYLLTGPKGRSAKAWDRLRRVAKAAFEHYIAVASLVTVLATLFYGFADGRFFHALNVTPEQVGLSPSMILTRSALGGLFLTVVLSIACFAGAVAVIPIRVDHAARGESAKLRDLVLNLFISLAGCAYLFGAGTIRGYPHNLLFFVFGLFPLIFFLLTSFRLRDATGGWRPRPKPLDFDFDKYLTYFIAVALPVGLLTAGLLTVEKADLYGQDAQAGFAVRNPALIGLPFLGIRAEPALVSWSGDSPQGIGLPQCLLFIGGSDGEVFLYDHRSHHTFQARSSAVTLTFLDEAESCDVPLNRRPPSIRRLGRNELVCSPGVWGTPYGFKLSFEWILHGVPLDNEAFRPRIFRSQRRWLVNAVRCRVVASNYYGKEIAVSPSRATGLGDPGVQP